MHFYNFLKSKGLSIFCFILIFRISLSDCPMSFYPEGTFAGSIQTNIDNAAAKSKQFQYPFNLVQPLTSTSPKVALSKNNLNSVLNSLSYHSNGGISFNVFYKPSPSFSQLLFVVNVTEQGKSKWNFMRFSFFASENKIFELGSQYVSTFTSTELETRKLITYKLPLEILQQKPVLKVFMNGLSVSSTLVNQEIEQIKSQIDRYKALNWSDSIVKVLEKKLSERETFQVQLSNIEIDKKTLSFFVDLGFKQSIEFISFSYVVFDRNQVPYKNQYIEGRFTFTYDSFINLPSLQNMDLFFVGIESLKFRQFDTLSLLPTFLINQNQTFSLFHGFSQAKNSFFMQYFAISRSQDSYCSHCKDGSIYYQNFCISQCPQGYVKRVNGSVTYCELCEIKLLKVPNLDRTQCVCAKQHFQVLIKNSNEFTCSACNYQCLTCESEFKCLTCDGMYLNTFRIFQPQSSQCLCAPGYYDDGQNNIKCLKCHQSCLKCNGPTLFDCEACSKGRIKGMNGNCICDGNFVDRSGSCVCEEPNFSYKSYCFTFLTKSKCSQNQLQVMINGTQVCQCKPSYQLFRSVCILCGQNENVDNQTGKCICKQNFYRDEIQGACIECGSGKYYSEQAKRCVCGKGSFQTSDGRCLKCGRRETLIKDECQCVYNYFRNEKGNCQKCGADSVRVECRVNMN